MTLTRREAGVLSIAALIAATAGAKAATPGVMVRSDNQPLNLDPHQVFDVPMMGYSLNAYDTLYRYLDNPPKLTPWIAESHTSSEDGLIWDFKIRPGVKFHDGSDLTAADVVWSFQRVLKIARAPAAAFRPILTAEQITAPDPSTVRFTLSRPYGPFLAAIPIVAIVNPRVLKANEKNDDWGASWLASNEAGSGAYKLDAASYAPNEKYEMNRWDGHWYGWKDNPKPVQKIASRTVKETSTGVLGLLNGSIDMTDSYLPTDQVEQISASKVARVEKNVSARTFIIRMNNSKAPFDNINARKCFAHAFNYKGFIEDILKGYAERDPTPMPTTLWGFPKDVKGYEYDLDKARDYFKKAMAEGAPMRRPIQIHIQNTLEQTNQAAQLFQSDLAQIGVNLRIVNDTWANMTTNTAKPETSPDMWVHWVSTYFADPENWVGQMYDSQFHGTWKASSWFKNAEVDELLRKARGLVKQEERAPLYEQATRLIVEQSPDIFIYNTVELKGVSNRLSTMRFCPVGSGTEMRWVQMTS
ncbi:ABC transporter substrate-binding protein [Enterovirga rhinocerotis]|uniref:Peptide/nickel transport system substrate-binding protein n=1 Tax=Enterovirga rhinocerotis TaxID=1339210 RepID=A0A4R7BWC8_9HYPH|nr:ABC transporter substrate-binding protein [Enterovirga rhinocerotis]TDR89783.1 peptide/nickel transport system substrate-binding protein [Enterovirga rhinocerotis]